MNGSNIGRETSCGGKRGLSMRRDEGDPCSVLSYMLQLHITLHYVLTLLHSGSQQHSLWEMDTYIEESAFSALIQHLCICGLIRNQMSRRLIIVYSWICFIFVWHFVKRVNFCWAVRWMPTVWIYSKCNAKYIFIDIFSTVLISRTTLVVTCVTLTHCPW